MPRYFFHLYNDINARDEEGSDLPDIEAARARARDAAVELISHSVARGHLNLDHRIEVADQSGEVLFKVPFRDVFTIEG